jgi:hypothetical protein
VNRFSKVAFIAGTSPKGLLPALDAAWCERFGAAITLQPFIQSSTYQVAHLFDPMIREHRQKFQKTEIPRVTTVPVPLADMMSHKRTQLVENDLSIR